MLHALNDWSRVDATTMKRLFYAVLAGGACSYVPTIVIRHSPTSSIGGVLWFVSALFAMPGTLVAMVAALGKFDDIDFRIAGHRLPSE